MHLLLDDQIKAPRPVLGTVVSTVMHAGLFAALIVGGGRVVEDISDAMQQTVRYLIPSDRAKTSRETTIEFSAAPGAPIAPTPDGTAAATGNGGFARTATKSLAPSDAERDHFKLEGGEPTATENAISYLDVDSAAVRDPASAAPSYPLSLIEKQVEGSAMMRFVVDTTGQIDMATVQVLRASHPLFAKAVTDAMPLMRFRPAIAGNHIVRQLAEQEFRFKLQPKVENPLTKKP